MKDENPMYKIMKNALSLIRSSLIEKNKSNYSW